MSRLSEQWRSWFGGIQGEINFWTQWVETSGGAWPEDFSRRMNSETPLDPYVEAAAKELRRGVVHILDVGSGPITGLGYRSHELTCSIRACDPLAFAYDLIFSTHNVDPPVRTEFATVEDLSCFYSPGSFDIVHCRNALDHSLDPVRGIVEMMNVVRLGGEVVLKHSRNEAENEGYSGFHQFNLDEIDGQFVVWNKDVRFDISEMLLDVAEIKLTTDENQIWVRIRKVGSLKHQKASDRVSELSRGMVEWMIQKALSDVPPEHFVSLSRLRSLIGGSEKIKLD